MKYGNIWILCVLFSISLVSRSVQAADLIIEPASPTLEVGQSIDLSVSGATGTIIWTAANGQIENSGLRVNYMAPGQKGTDVVTVFDGNGNIGTVKITVNQEKPRAAILIHANGQGNNSQSQSFNFIASYAYKTLIARGYKHDDIYFLSAQSDLEVDKENVVDAPVSFTDRQNGAVPRNLTIADIRAALDWAKTKGKLTEPLVIIFVGQGLPNQLWLDSSGEKIITPTQFKALLDDYQNATGNQMVVILEAGYSGTFVPILAKTNRVIISSTGNGLSYYNSSGQSSFLKLYLDQLRLGEDLWQAKQTVTDTLSSYMPPLNQQSPQLNDSATGKLAQQLCLNGCSGNLPGILTLTVDALPPIVPMGQPLSLNVFTHFTIGDVQAVTGSLFMPTISFNNFGYPFQPPPMISFNFLNTRRRDSKRQWQGQVSADQVTTPGLYTLMLNALDHEEFSADKAVTFCVETCTRLINLSTRAPILGGANNVIAGFIIEGTGTQQIVLRGWGLEAGVDPMLTLQKQVNNQWSIVAGNNNWQRGSRYLEIPSQMTKSFETNDAALLLDLTAGVYTLNLSSVGKTGRGLVGVDAVGSNQNIKLINLSTRAPIKGGADNVVAGFIIEGTGTQKIVLRGWGLDAGVNPKLILQKLSNETWQEVARNNDWRTDSRHAEIPAYMTANFESNDAALLRDLPVGVYTVTLSSVGINGLGLIGVDIID